MQTDSLFYCLFQTAPALLFELTGQPNPFAETYTFRSIELKQTAFRIDGVFVPDPITPEAPIYFVEVQFQPDSQLYARLFTEVMIFLRQHPTVQAWNMVILYGDRRCQPLKTGAFTALVELPHVQELFLNELAIQASESIELGLVRLIVASETTALERAQQLVAQARETPSRLSSAAIIEMIETILIYKFPHMSWQEVEAMFGLSELKQTRVYQQGREEGLEQGLERGLEQGRDAEARSLIFRLLTRKLGTLPNSTQTQLNALSLADVEALGEALLDFSSLEDLQQWLSAHS